MLGYLYNKLEEGYRGKWEEMRDGYEYRFLLVIYFLVIINF